MGGNHSLVDFNAVDDVYRQVGQRHVTALAAEGHAIQKVADGVARQTVDGQIEIRTYTALFAYLDAGRAVYQVAQVVQ